jgi:hypothetical protein
MEWDFSERNPAAVNEELEFEVKELTGHVRENGRERI